MCFSGTLSGNRRSTALRGRHVVGRWSALDASGTTHLSGVRRQSVLGLMESTASPLKHEETNLDTLSVASNAPCTVEQWRSVTIWCRRLQVQSEALLQRRHCKLLATLSRSRRISRKGVMCVADCWITLENPFPGEHCPIAKLFVQTNHR